MKVIFIDDSTFGMKLFFDGQPDNDSKNLLQELIKNGHTFKIFFLGNAEKFVEDANLPGEVEIDEFLDDFAAELSYDNFQRDTTEGVGKCVFKYSEDGNASIDFDDIISKITGDYTNILKNWGADTDISTLYDELKKETDNADIILIDMFLICDDEKRLTPNNEGLYGYIPLLSMRIAEKLQSENKKFLIYSSFTETRDYTTGFKAVCQNANVELSNPEISNRYNLTVQKIFDAALLEQEG